MNDMIAAVRSNPVFIRHDLMIEMGRLEMEIEHLREVDPQVPPARIQPLQQRLQMISRRLDMAA